MIPADIEQKLRESAKFWAISLCIGEDKGYKEAIENFLYTIIRETKFHTLHDAADLVKNQNSNLESAESILRELAKKHRND